MLIFNLILPQNLNLLKRHVLCNGGCGVPPRFSRFLTMIARHTFALICWVSFSFAALAQDIELETATIHDQNIFDIYSATPDQITQLQLNASHDWDANQFTFSASYVGAFFRFNDLSARNYHLHALTVGTSYQFYGGEDDPPDSSGNPAGAPSGISHADSLDRFLSLTLLGASQFDKIEFEQYDNSRIQGSLQFRQPLGSLLVSWPSYSLTYRSYPNLPGLTNVEHLLSLGITGSTAPRGSFTAGFSYGIKHYPFTTVHSFMRGSASTGVGKGGASGGLYTVSDTMSIGHVAQPHASLQIKQAFPPGTVFIAQFTRYANPSTTARTLRGQVGNTGEDDFFAGNAVARGEVFDDHYAFSANEIFLQIDQTFPFALTLTLRGQYASKKYSTPAFDLSDTLLIADHRLDDRWEGAAVLSRPFALGAARTLEARAELHYFRNESNAPYYDFRKNTFMLAVGVEF